MATACTRQHRDCPSVIANKRDEWTDAVGPPVRSQQQAPAPHPRRPRDPHGVGEVVAAGQHAGRSFERNAHGISDLATGSKQTVGANRAGLRRSGPGRDDTGKTTENTAGPLLDETRAQAQTVSLCEGVLVDPATQAFHDACMKSIEAGPDLGKRERLALPNRQGGVVAGGDPRSRRHRQGNPEGVGLRHLHHGDGPTLDPDPGDPPTGQPENVSRRQCVSRSDRGLLHDRAFRRGCDDS